MAETGTENDRRDELNPYLPPKLHPEEPPAKPEHLHTVEKQPPIATEIKIRTVLADWLKISYARKWPLLMNGLFFLIYTIFGILLLVGIYFAEKHIQTFFRSDILAFSIWLFVLLPVFIWLMCGCVIHSLHLVCGGASDFRMIFSGLRFMPGVIFGSSFTFGILIPVWLLSFGLGYTILDNHPTRIGMIFATIPVCGAFILSCPLFSWFALDVYHLFDRSAPLLISIEKGKEYLAKSGWRISVLTGMFFGFWILIVATTFIYAEIFDTVPSRLAKISQVLFLKGVAFRPEGQSIIALSNALGSGHPQ